MKKIVLLILIIVCTSLVVAYTAPDNDDVDLVLDTGYTAPDNLAVNLVLGDVTPPDSCSCPSATDWNADAADNCVITSNCYIPSNTFNCYGDGTFTIASGVVVVVDKRIKGDGCKFIEKGGFIIK